MLISMSLLCFYKYLTSSTKTDCSQERQINGSDNSWYKYKGMHSNSWAFQMALVVNNPPANARDIRDMGSIPGSRSSFEEGMATYSSMLAWRIPWTRAWRATVHRVTKSWTRLKQLIMHVYIPTLRQAVY